MIYTANIELAIAKPFDISIIEDAIESKVRELLNGAKKLDLLEVEVETNAGHCAYGQLVKVDVGFDADIEIEGFDDDYPDEQDAKEYAVQQEIETILDKIMIGDIEARCMAVEMTPIDEEIEIGFMCAG